MKTTILVLSVLFSSLCKAADKFEILRQIQSKEVHFFLLRNWASAEVLELENKIPVAVTLAVALLESGAGKRKLARQQNNIFRIYDCGIYKTYNCSLDCFKDFAKEVEKCSNNSHTIGDWLQVLKKCKSKSYSIKIQSIIKKHNLYL